MIDFTNCIKNYKYYSGADRKISITYDSKDYLLKFPNYVKDNKEASTKETTKKTSKKTKKSK